MNAAFWQGKRVLVTGHTGFKGSWLTHWLSRMGATITGFALAPPTEPNLYTLSEAGALIRPLTGDLRDLEAVRKVFRDADPEIVFHLAAQSLVRVSYREPLETLATNVMGTAHVLEAARDARVAAVVVATSDKCYENRGSTRGYVETDPLGGTDPYSGSKACAELVTAAYRHSFFSDGDAARIATVRAGNVIGGGDWAEDRLVPDVIAALSSGVPVRIRRPDAVRPWQHVLEPLHGYLMLAERLAGGPEQFASAWNFGPPTLGQSVKDIVRRMIESWGSGSYEVDAGVHPHEASLLHVDSTKAASALGWSPHLSFDETVDWTVAWYREQLDGASARTLVERDIERFEPRCDCGARNDRAGS